MTRGRKGSKISKNGQHVWHLWDSDLHNLIVYISKVNNRKFWIKTYNTSIIINYKSNFILTFFLEKNKIILYFKKGIHTSYSKIQIEKVGLKKWVYWLIPKIIFNQKIIVRLRLQMQKNYYNNLKRKWINAKSNNLNEFVFYSFSTFSLAVQCDKSKDPKHKIEEK